MSSLLAKTSSLAFTGSKTLDLLTNVFLASLLYTITLGIYRLFFHPLARFPGPRLAALTQWYETYYDVYLDGKFILHLQKLHEIYGPIIRINPWEIHINDPEMFETIYSTTNLYDKVPQHVAWTNSQGAIQSTVSHTLHRSRKAALLPLFSKGAISLFAPEIQARADKLVNRINTEYRDTGRVLRIDDIYGCFTTDVVTQYAFAKDYGYLDSEDWKPAYIKTMAKFAGMYKKLWHFPILFPILGMLGEERVEKINPGMAEVFKFRKDVENQIKDIIDNKNEKHKDVSHHTVFRELLDSDLPPEEKELKRMRFEGTGIVSAGMETTKWVLSVATFYVLNDPDVLARLKKELLEAWPDDDIVPSLAELEKPPYLSAVIHEALRLSYGVPMRLPRVSTSPLTYTTLTTNITYIIPAGVPFSSSFYLLHHNETIFPSSHSFLPSRWLPDPFTGLPPTGPTGKLLSRYLGTFSRGTRGCLGIHLAHAELWVLIANVFRRCELELYGTGKRDVEMWCERFITQVHPNSKGIRVLVK